jgi:hypothetical protein
LLHAVFCVQDLGTVQLAENGRFYHDSRELNNSGTARPKQTQTAKCRAVGDALWFHSNRLLTLLRTVLDGATQWDTSIVPFLV